MGDAQIQRSLIRVMEHFDHARQEAIAELTPAVWERYRERGRQIKRHTIENLDYYLELLCDRVTHNGGQVHFARDAEEANSIVVGLARARNVRVVTKGKSMVSEEMGLNHALEQVGIEAVETDLGEYIIQLAEETPFHIIAPAMHKTREDVSRLFAEKIHVPGLQNIEQLAQTARETLRPKFFQADMGITGANFLVAETGTLVLVTNEGNGRFCSSAPRIHVAITGMEKVVPSLEDLAVFLRLLPRAATGQRITTYMSFVSGPRRSDDEDGPEEFHLVVVDNGRSRLLQDPELRESLYCIRCGACLNICPVYRKVGGHAYGWVYPGPIGAVISPVMSGMKEAKDLPFASSLCGACKEACPVKINIPHMLLHLRGKLMESPNPVERRVGTRDKLLARSYVAFMSRPTLIGWMRKWAWLAQAPFAGRGWMRKIPLPLLSRWTRDRDLPPLPRKSFRQIWDRALSKEQ